MVKDVTLVCMVLRNFFHKPCLLSKIGSKKNLIFDKFILFEIVFFRYLLYVTQLINNQDLKPHKYSVYIKSVTMHPVPAFNKARYDKSLTQS